ncbi:hypothetical protein [Acetobacter oeni]|uniref:Lipoprotein n=1 Tax=Acetobacter oeni TaxID=304077 RepID=A0A511XIJ7_9PROT|nr:hypothetical protein [Acetobacter oeni]MBB3881876.1 hypothetical protein [Acetobacter oeni]NHO17797.1 hypothetical protein [Acetobacter oeni]GBR03440.1 hypothetical protein AA21952_1054 [Acetobacter oeni LMG 21952]GEN62772.1 hypothetical protein AOE01nite_09960 [Acetobacter oeni]
MSRRTLFCSAVRAAGALGAASALAACTATTSGGTTTYTVNVDRVLSIVSSIEAGLTEIATSSAVIGVIGADNAATLATILGTISEVTAGVAATSASTVSLTVGAGWIATVESAAQAAIGLLQDFESLLPSQATLIIQAVSALLPALETLIGAVSVSVAMTPSQAQNIIARGL